ncbi:ankyrin repeat domain-containing protein 27-like [Diorhabda carinulata]|uniref:ankyrin repeat domain-containing protein 27-like n=1 Tax=Diorhabda carinulata TaxID=1163345 RepID=UPI0025A0C6A7|nr:ankyrin repeat domain-containing protein 27-like [Diorhabda carinulata]
MWSQYDENLSINPFFKEIYNNHPDIIEESSLRQWIICVPRIGTIEKETITNEVILDHIIVSTRNTDDSVYTLSKKQIFVSNKKISTYPGDNIDILFEETHYVNNNSKFLVWCIERPIFSEKYSFYSDYNENLSNIHDCIDFLWCYRDIFVNLKILIENFSFDQNFVLETIQNQKELIGILFSRCLQRCFTFSLIKEKCNKENRFLNKIKQAVETYMQYCIGRKLIFGINTILHEKDSSLNRIIKKNSNIMYKDLGIETGFESVILNAKFELKQLNNHDTVLDKIFCLKKTVTTILDCGKHVTSDDLLQILVFIIIKSNINNWYGNLIYIKEFNLSNEVTEQTLFCISSLEAALEFILEHLLEDLNRNLPSDCIKSHPLSTRIDCINTPDRYGTNELLLEATKLRKLDTIEFLLKTDVNVNFSDSFGRTSLHYACLNGFQDVLLLLITKNADVNVKDFEQNTPLHLSCLNGNDNCVKALIYSSMRTEVNIANSTGDTPLIIAARWGYLDIVQILLENRASVFIKNKKNRSVFDLAHNAFIYKLCEKFTTKIEKIEYNNSKIHGIKPKNDEQLKKIDLLLKSIENNDFPLTCFYLGYNSIDRNINKGKCHPLCICERCKSDLDDLNHVTTNKLLLNINMCDNKGYTALHVAAKYGRNEILRILLDIGALSNLKTYQTLYTPLHLACIYERVQVIRELVKCGDCNIDEQDDIGNTSLFYACQKGNVKIVDILLKNGADCDIKNLLLSGENMQYGLFKLLKSYSKNYS